MCEYLLWKGWWHGIGDHWWWSWWLLARWWWWWLRVEWEWWMIHSILSRPLHAPKLWGALEALVSEGTHLICWSSKMSLSITAAITVASIGANRVFTITSIATTILDLTATKATFWPPTKSPIIVPVPVAATTVAAPPAPRIPITAVILEATSPPPSTTWMTEMKQPNY